MRVYPTCDNDCVEMEWIEILAECPDGSTIHFSVDPNVEYLAQPLYVFSHDSQTMIHLHGGNFSSWQLV